MKANNNPVLLSKKKIDFEAEERKENILINMLAKSHLRKLIKDKKRYDEIHILNDMYFVRR